MAFFYSAVCLLVLTACHNKSRIITDTIARSPQELQEKATNIIRQEIDEAINYKGRLEDSTQLSQPRLTKILYEKNSYVPVWSNKEEWLAAGDTLYQFIKTSQHFGLFPEDYHVKELAAIRQQFINDSSLQGDRKNASLWSKADIMLTDAFLGLVKDIKLGRLPQDSITLRKDSVLSDEFYLQQFATLQQDSSLARLIQSLEPKQRGYRLLKEGIQKFLDNAEYREFTVVPSPGKDAAKFKKALQQRLFEGGYVLSDSIKADSSQLAAAIKKFQKEKGIAVDGRAGEWTLRMLNTSDREKFIRIAISLDKYKMLPEEMPPRYIWINLPSFYLHVIEGDSVLFSSKIICGKAKTTTPLLNSAISQLITYPIWTIPNSIIVKEVLPALKKNPGYLARKGFSLVGKDGEVDPYGVDWAKYSKGIPYRVIQGSGDANALGVFKFYFDNKYSVYLHDTNQRYLFGQAMRSISHGCVRVQEWQRLAFYILHNDSLNGGSRAARIDSVRTWLKRKEKHSIALKNKMPVFIRYITCEGKDGSIVFYDDIYGEDKMLREKYFAPK